MGNKLEIAGHLSPNSISSGAACANPPSSYLSSSSPFQSLSNLTFDPQTPLDADLLPFSSSLSFNSPFQVFCKLPCGKTLPLDVRPSDSVFRVKFNLHSRLLALGLRVPQMCRLVAKREGWRQVEMEDSRTMEDYGVKREATLYLMPPKRGVQISTAKTKLKGREREARKGNKESKEHEEDEDERRQGGRSAKRIHARPDERTEEKTSSSDDENPAAPRPEEDRAPDFLPPDDSEESLGFVHPAVPLSEGSALYDGSVLYFSGSSRTGITSVTVTEGVKALGRNALFGCTSLTELRLPNTVREIQDGACGHCEALSCVSFPSSLRSIGQSAFSNCLSLLRVSLPPGVVAIGAQAFEGCATLHTVSLPPSLVRIGAFAFERCVALSDIAVPKGAHVGEHAFLACSRLLDCCGPLRRGGEEGNVGATQSLTELLKGRWEKEEGKRGREAVLCALRRLTGEREKAAEASDPSRCAGLLLKRNRKGAWRSRWFELSFGFLTYYESSQKKRLLATLKLSNVGEIDVKFRASRSGTIFTVEGPSRCRVFEFRAASVEDGDRWVAALRRAKKSFISKNEKEEEVNETRAVSPDSSFCDDSTSSSGESSANDSSTLILDQSSPSFELRSSEKDRMKSIWTFRVDDYLVAENGSPGIVTRSKSALGGGAQGGTQQGRRKMLDGRLAFNTITSARVWRSILDYVVV